MDSVRKITSSKYARFVLIEVAIFVAIALISRTANTSYEALLIIAGIVLVFLPYMGAYTHTTSRDIYSDEITRNELRQGMDYANRRLNATLLHPIQLVALPLLVVGIILMLIP